MHQHQFPLGTTWLLFAKWSHLINSLGSFVSPQVVHHLKHRFRGLFLLILLSLLSFEAIAVAKPSLTIKKASWSAKTNQLIITGVLKNSPAGTEIEINDLEGRRLGVTTATAFSLTIDGKQLAVIPCSLRAKAGNLEIVKAVKGNPNKECKALPTCQITAANGVNNPNAIHVDANKDVNFSAMAKFSNKNAQPKYEWDFSGGVMGEADSSNPAVDNYKRPSGTSATVKFIRDNSHYRVHFSAVDGSVAAMESKQYRCEDVIDVVVGSPPNDLLPKVAEETPQNLGSELLGKADDYVVMPFEDWTMQMDSDANFMPDIYNSTSPAIHNIKAVVYKKALRPPVVQAPDVQLFYSAASNPNDPVGPDSINSTSQNWPLSSDILQFSPMMTATVQKSQLWEKYSARDTSMQSPEYKRHFWAAFGSNYPFSPLEESVKPYPDEGYIVGVGKQNDPNVNGSFMPGKADPYNVNEPQPFGQDNTDSNLHEVRMLPLSGVDDQNRVNPYPLFRVQAKVGGDVMATTDAVKTAGRDFHCRGCHAKGKIGANPNAPYTKEAFASTPTGKMKTDLTPVDKPQLFAPADFGGDPNNIHDQERAAALNLAGVHDFYDGIDTQRFSLYGSKDWTSPTSLTDPVDVDGPVQCSGCHATPQRFVNFGVGPDTWWDGVDHDPSSMMYDPNYTISLHRFHGELQWNDANKTDIKRQASGIYARWDWKNNGQNNTNDTSLFPIFDKASGKQLPMEENCLKCHEGEREAHYRDRMATVGVTCYDCHGDMLAVGEAYPKNFTKDQSKLGSTDLRDYRLAWFDNPDCASCHTGNVNVGKDGQGSYYSAGVMRRAFDDQDPSASPRVIDRSNVDAVRFSAAPLTNYQMSFTTTVPVSMDPVTMETTTSDVPVTFDAPLFRFGKDSHGNVPCSACHGAAHAIWPNRNPNANDNVTAMQLQGHTGSILECNVCHTADSFKYMKDLDGGKFMTDLKPDSGVLGGPHNTHPINDPYWWKSSQAPTDTTSIDGSTYGGWHNNYAKIKGKAGEDQCAACHGNDHKGTRLSKTPVDRVFDFSDFDFAKLKKAGFKSKVIKVAAGTPIGCDTCHSIQTSCIGSPAGADKCGTAYVSEVSGNGTLPQHQAPTITSHSTVLGLNERASYSYQVTATPANATFTYSLLNAPADMAISSSGLITWTAKKVTGNNGTASFTVNVTDSANAEATQAVSVKVCVAPQTWNTMGGGMCM